MTGDVAGDVTVTRRQVCIALAGLGAQALLGCRSGGGDGAGSSSTAGTSVLPTTPGSSTTTAASRVAFEHGVATFDPSPDGFVLWTRARDASSEDAIELDYVVARDVALRDVVARGSTETDPEADHTAAVVVDGLDPGTTYYYALSSGGATSPTGRTRTVPDGSSGSIRLGLVSCSNHAFGFFAAYAELARRDDIDAIVHLGDYVYEYGVGTYDDPTLTRAHQPAHEALTLDDYRMRYSQYRRDPDLQEVHRQHPMLAIWDDHEFANDAFSDGADNHQANEGAWAERRAGAAQAFLEWVPLRRNDDGGIYRSVRFGDLAELALLDTRHAGRDRQPSISTASSDPGRQMLGAKQEEWLGETLRQAAADEVAWRLIGQQVMVAPLTLRSRVLNVDQWDGYPAARARLLDLLDETGDSVILTGDIHSSWAMDVPREAALYDADTGAGSIAVELVTPAVTSPALSGSLGVAAGQAARLVPHVRWADLRHRGYVVLDVERDRVQADWYHLDDVSSRVRRARFAAGFVTTRGSRHLEQATLPLEVRSGPEPAR